MTNPYYDHSTYPASGSFGTSSGLRAEFDAVEAGFDKLPELSGNGGKLVGVNAGASALEPVDSTGTGAPVRSAGATMSNLTLSGQFSLATSAGNVSSGGTVTLTNDDPVYINVGSATKAALTFALPTASLRDGQTHRIATHGAITAVTVTAGAATVVGAPTTLAFGGFFMMQYRLSNTTWYRVG